MNVQDKSLWFKALREPEHYGELKYWLDKKYNPVGISSDPYLYPGAIVYVDARLVGDNLKVTYHLV